MLFVTKWYWPQFLKHQGENNYFLWKQKPMAQHFNIWLWVLWRLELTMENVCHVKVTLIGKICELATVVVINRGGMSMIGPRHVDQTRHNVYDWATTFWLIEVECLWLGHRLLINWGRISMFGIWLVDKPSGISIIEHNLLINRGRNVHD